jgi:6-pyruvoyltetrahydropterin/6-carboxytetrahydropterin synthase
MGKFQSSKVFDGFNTMFRQWKAETTFRRFIRGYGISFKIYFEGELDEQNKIFDFESLKRTTTLIDGKQPKAWIDYIFDHTMIIAEDDPELAAFKMMDDEGVAQVRVIPSTGTEKFAEYIFNKINEFITAETFNRVRVTKVKFTEQGKNSAYYCE